MYESELAVLMSWIDGTALSPFPREELARLLIRIAKNPGLAPFTLTATHIYASMAFSSWLLFLMFISQT